MVYLYFFFPVFKLPCFRVPALFNSLPTMVFQLLRHTKLVRRPLFSQSIRNNGYIVLLPQLDENAHKKFPLLQKNGLPEFCDISVDYCRVAMGRQAVEFETGVKQLEDKLIDGKELSGDVFKDVIDVVEDMEAPLDMTWALGKTLFLGNGVAMSAKDYLAIHNRARRARATKFASNSIYQVVKTELEKTDITSKPTNEKHRVLEKYALEGRLNGLELTDDKRSELRTYLNKLSIEKAQFKEKFDIATDRFKHEVIDYEIVKDFPKSLLKKLAENPREPLVGPWTFKLNSEIYKPVMEHCPDRTTRSDLWQAFVKIGSGLNGPHNDRFLATGINLEEIRGARHDIATILGYKSFAEMSMETKMAGNVENVQNLISLLLEKAKPAQDEELQNLYEFAKERGFEGSRIELWDLAFWRRKQCFSLFNYKEEDYKQYFFLPTVVQGLFKLCEKLFNIRIQERKEGVKKWNPCSTFYEVFEGDSSTPLGGFYLDCFARSNAKNHRFPENAGWVVGIMNRSQIVNTNPLVALIFHFDAPTRMERSLHISFKQVTHLFHKFGLALQHLLTRANYLEVSGSSNIEWDAVKVCGHVLTHWLQNPSVLDSISNGKLPAEMGEALFKVHRHLAGVDLSHELYLSALDLELHQSKDYWLDIVKHLWPQFRSFPLEKIDTHPCAFTQIFTDEWAAAYYSHIWSRTIAADVYSAFHEVQGQEDKVAEVGKRFRDTFLALGGGCHPSEVFRKFRGRDPSPQALLSSLGLNNK